MFYCSSPRPNRSAPPQLLFTVLERSTDDVIRSNIIVALGDMSFRFPNLIEPWTPNIYARWVPVPRRSGPTGAPRCRSSAPSVPLEWNCLSHRGDQCRSA